MANDRPRRTPFEPSLGIAVPLVSLALSMPTNLLGLAAIVISADEVITRRSLVATSQVVTLPGLGVGLGCLYLVMGPLVAVVMCISQRTHAEQAYGSSLLLGFRIKRLNTIALRSAVLALCMIAVMFIIAIAAVSLNPK